MAKASPDLDEEKRRENSDELDAILNEMTPLQRYLLIGNVDGIKNQDWWKKPEIYKNTYFILPSAANDLINSIFRGDTPVDIEDFIKFWSELSDQHKERRFMVDYLCAIRAIEEMNGLEPDAVNILREMVSEYTWIFRLLLIKGQDDQKKLQEVVSVWIKAAFAAQNDDDVDDLMDFFDKPYATALTAFKKMKGDCADTEILNDITCYYLQSVMHGLVDFYMAWASFDLKKVISYAENQRKHDMESVLLMIMAKCIPVPKEVDRKDFMGKVKASVPHWNKIDRAKILGIIEKSGSGPKDYMTRLLEEFGLEQFKVLALGKEYFCANCNRSSYIGEERLWCCPRCVWEGTRPRARYCNENCQKAVWTKHKMEYHSVDICNTCKKKEAPDSRLFRCGRCIKENIPNPAHYCDKICQKKAWPKHKEAKHTKKEE